MSRLAPRFALQLCGATPTGTRMGRCTDLNDLLFFTAVVEQAGFFPLLGRVLNLPKSSVSRHVARLEARLGVRLLERSTRKLRVTEVGKEYYSRCRAILADLDLADRDVSEHRSKPAGIIRVSCPTGIAQYGLAYIVPALWRATALSVSRFSPPTG